MRRLCLCLALALSGPVTAQDLLHQPTDGSAPGPMPQHLLDQLDDPFFNAVIQANPQPLSLTASISAMLEGGQSDFESFVVDEQIGRPEITTPECGAAVHRMVISFTGTHAPSSTVLSGNVFISVFLAPSGPFGNLEVLAWDQTHRTYNYYKLEGGSWRLRNRSVDLATTPANDLEDGCLACHVNGGPIMKEFAFPWNHWHGLPITFTADYLRPGPQSWPVADSDLFGQRFAGAEVLETTIQSSLQRFADTLIDEKVETLADGTTTVTGIPDLIDSLFRPTELNLGSSNTKSGLDGGGLTQRPVRSMNIPDSFFVNIAQMRDIGLPVFQGQGLITEVFTPGNLGLTVSEYEDLLAEFDISTPCMPGRDTLFAWFGSEPSEFDRRMVERLNRRDIVDDGFVAAALAVDVETPLFSDARASLLAHVPDSIAAPSQGLLASVLRDEVIASLEVDPDRTEAEEDFLALLQGDAVGELDRRVRDFIARTRDALSEDARRMPHLRELYGNLIENRLDFLQSDISTRLAEFPGLFPLE